jgi:hypothetical protein
LVKLIETGGAAEAEAALGRWSSYMYSGLRPHHCSCGRPYAIITDTTRTLTRLVAIEFDTTAAPRPWHTALNGLNRFGPAPLLRRFSTV